MGLYPFKCSTQIPHEMYPCSHTWCVWLALRHIALSAIISEYMNACENLSRHHHIPTHAQKATVLSRAVAKQQTCLHKAVRKPPD